MQASRRRIEAQHAPEESVTFDQLAAQRRLIYAKLTPQARWWNGAPFRRWASAAATVLVLGGGLMVYEQTRQQQATDKLSDAQLTQEVSRMAQDSEPSSTAPLHQLFEQ
jgi:hypothetical protein